MSFEGAALVAIGIQKQKLTRGELHKANGRCRSNVVTSTRQRTSPSGPEFKSGRDFAVQGMGRVFGLASVRTRYQFKFLTGKMTTVIRKD